MLIAVIGASHGNSHALTAALEAIEIEGILTVITTGGYAMGSANPGEAVDRIRNAGAICVQAPSDRVTAQFHRKRKRLEKELDPETFAAAQAAYESLSSVQIEWLLGLPKEERTVVDGLSVAVYSDSEAGTETVGGIANHPERLRRLREQANAHIVIVGGDKRFSLAGETALIVGPGPLMSSDESDEVTYAVISTETEPWSVEFRRVPLSGAGQ